MYYPDSEVSTKDQLTQKCAQKPRRMRGGHNKPADLEVGTETSRLRGGHKNQQTRVESVSTFGRYVKVFFYQILHTI